MWDPDHLQAKRDGKGEVAMEEVERGRVVRVEMEDVASGLEWTQIGVYMPVRGQAKVTIAASGGTQDPETKDPAQDAWESLSDELGYSIMFDDVKQCSTSLNTSGEWP